MSKGLVTRSAQWKRRQSEDKDERYCTHGRHFVPAEQATRRRHGDTGHFICDACYEKRRRRG